MLSDRDLLVAKEMEPKVLKEINRLQEQDKEIAARYKAQFPQEQGQQSAQQQSGDKGYDHNSDAMALKEAKEEAAANRQFDQGHHHSAPSHEPSH